VISAARVRRRADAVTGVLLDEIYTERSAPDPNAEWNEYHHLGICESEYRCYQKLAKPALWEEGR
jgi:hypothetical protein